MNLAAFRTAVNRRTGEAFDTDALTELVNHALAAIAAEQDWPWLEAEDTFSTVADQADYAMPADWARTRAVTIDGDDIELSSARDYTYHGETGLPVRFQVVADKLRLVPTPGATTYDVIHRYVRTEPALALDGDSPLLPVAFHPAVVEYASYLVMLRTGNAKRADEFFRSWSLWRDRMKDSRRRSVRRHRIRVRSRHPFGD